MSNYANIYCNTVRNIILNIAIDFISDGKFPDDIIINKEAEKIEVKCRDWVIFTLCRADEISDKELLVKMLNYIYYL